jgi:sigma-B regulation protein RsbU (phosphoserine phosphatase)
LPTQLPQVSGWEIAASFSPAREVAGDFYDAFSLQDDTKVCLVIADVCDKGVGAALFMALSRSLIHAFAEWQQAGVGNPIEFTNEYILRNHLQANMFITLFFGVLEPSTGLLSYVNSGHNPPVIIGATGVKTHLLPTGPATGIFPGWTFQLHQVYLEPGDVLFAYTDGVTEARNADGDFFTDKRLLQLLEEPAASAADLLQRVEESVRSYSAFADQSDDITMLVARRRLLHES